MSLIIAQSAFRCSLFDTVCSASKGPPFAVADAGPAGLATSFAAFASTFGFSRSTAAGVRAWASSFLCRGVDAKTRREESRSSSVGDCRERSVGPVLREHETKPGRKSSRPVNMVVLVLFDAQRRFCRRGGETFLEALTDCDRSRKWSGQNGQDRRVGTTMVVHKGAGGLVVTAPLHCVRAAYRYQIISWRGRVRFAAEVCISTFT